MLNDIQKYPPPKKTHKTEKKPKKLYLNDLLHVLTTYLRRCQVQQKKIKERSSNEALHGAEDKFPPVFFSRFGKKWKFQGEGRGATRAWSRPTERESSWDKKRAPVTQNIKAKADD